tara:strand:+ start:540 stop:890 length:351 start_codon:yes stop_codon:yes gene_type:complete
VQILLGRGKESKHARKRAFIKCNMGSNAETAARGHVDDVTGRALCRPKVNSKESAVRRKLLHTNSITALLFALEHSGCTTEGTHVREVRQARRHQLERGRAASLERRKAIVKPIRM